MLWRKIVSRKFAVEAVLPYVLHDINVPFLRVRVRVRVSGLIGSLVV